jgi:cell division protein ZapA
VALLTITINDRPFNVACDDGQEAHVLQRAQELDARVRRLAGAVGQVGDSLLLVMAGLLLTDELAEARSDAPAQPDLSRVDETLAGAVNALADRVEGIAERLRQA